MICKLRDSVSVVTNKLIYYDIFHSHISYVCTAWGQNLNSKHHINLLQEKAMRIISFASFDPHSLPIFAGLKIINFPDLISFCTGLFIYKHFLSMSPSVFFQMFSFWHLTLMNKTLGQHHMLFQKNHLAIL